MIEDALGAAVPWHQLRDDVGTAEGVPGAIRDLLNATSAEDAERAYWRLDNRVVVQGQLFEAAPWVVGPLLVGLTRPRPAFVREQVANLLVEIACGGPHESEPVDADGVALDARCQAELRRGLSLFYALVDDPVPMVRLGALDLLDAVEDNRERMAIAVARLVNDADVRVARRAAELRKSA